MSDVSIPELLDNLRRNFIEELPRKINLIEESILSSSESDSNDEIFRLVHSLKGSAGSYNCHIITKITHHLEDGMLYLAQKNKFNTDWGIDLLLEYIDLLKLAFSNINNNKFEFSHIESLLDSLNRKIFKETCVILIIEPSKSYIHLLEDSLKGLPVTLDFVNDGLAAMELLLVKTYSILITSMETPPLNADALVPALRCSNSINKDIFSLLITSYDESKIQNKEMFSLVEQKNIVKNGRLYSIIENLIAIK